MKRQLIKNKYIKQARQKEMGMASEHMRRAPCHSEGVKFELKLPADNTVQLSGWHNPKL